MNLPRRASFLLPLSLVGAGCKKGSTPESAGQEFIDRYYIERDHARALEVAAEGAAERIRSEQRLLQGSGAAGQGGQPRVYSKLEKQTQRPTGEQELTYALTIDSGGVKLHKRALLLLRSSGEQYKVVFFSEIDLPR